MSCGNEWSIDHLLQNSLVNKLTRDSKDEDVYANRFSLDVTHRVGARMLMQRLRFPGWRDMLRSRLETLDLQKTFGSGRLFPSSGGKVAIVLQRQVTRR
jgi:hypothetical protein